MIGADNGGRDTPRHSPICAGNVSNEARTGTGSMWLARAIIPVAPTKQTNRRNARASIARPLRHRLDRRIRRSLRHDACDQLLHQEKKDERRRENQPAGELVEEAFGRLLAKMI